MMKKLIVLGCVATMVMGLVAAASADTFQTDWFVNLRTSSNSTGTQASIGQNLKIGTKTGATDSPAGTTSEDARYTSSITATQSTIECFDLGTSNAKWATDMRAPLAWATDAATGYSYVAPKIWHLKLYAGDNWTATNPIYLTGWVPTTTGAKINPYGATNGGPRVALYDVTSIGYGDVSTPELARAHVEALKALTPLMVFAPGESGNYSSSTGFTGTTHQVQFAFGDKGSSSNPYMLELVAVPEPGSMLAMLSGLVGLVGFGIRRRK